MFSDYCPIISAEASNGDVIEFFSDRNEEKVSIPFWMYNHSVMLVLTLDFFSCMPLLNLFNFDIGGCPVFSEKISFADVIGCTR